MTVDIATFTFLNSFPLNCMDKTEPTATSSEAGEHADPGKTLCSCKYPFEGVTCEHRNTQALQDAVVIPKDDVHERDSEGGWARSWWIT